MDNIDRDAEEFGNHIKQGSGWRLGLLVARNVESSQGARTDLRTGAEVKVSGAEFARLSSASERTIQYYYNAWELAADEGVVEHAKNIVPGQAYELEVGKLPKWSTYYRKAKAPEPKQLMTRAEAEAITNEIAEFIARLASTVPKTITMYYCNGWAALGYDSWDALCKAEFPFSINVEPGLVEFIYNSVTISFTLGEDEESGDWITKWDVRWAS